MDTILQTPVNQIYDTVRVEILLSEAILVQQSLDNLEKHGLENTSEVVNELSYKINEAQQNAKKKGIKAQKVIYYIYNEICFCNIVFLHS